MKKFLRTLLIIFFFLSVIVIGVTVWSVKIEPNLLITRGIKLYIPNWHKEHNNFKIAVLTDMHIGSIGINLKKLEKIVELTNKQKPDIIFLLGDFDSKAIANSGIKQKDIIKAFKKFKAPYGVISVLGNHDFNPFIATEMLQKSNITVLKNQYIRVEKGNNTFYVVGLKDLWHYRPNVKKVISRVKSNQPIIVLSHNPDVFPEIPDKVSLTLSGHNHGGQAYLPFIGGLFLPSDYGQRYVKGYIVENGKHLYVSSGIGNCGPARFGNIPEIVILNISKQVNPKKYIINTPAKTGLNGNLIPVYLKIVRSDVWKRYFVPIYYKLI
jgi:predicted MPP superfamily phosphohydrolase